MASVAEARAVVHAAYRDGSAIDEKQAIAFMTETEARVRQKVAGAISIRADAGFWSKAMGAWLLKEGIPFAFALPLYSALKLHLMTVAFEVVAEEDEDIEVGVLAGQAMGYDARLRIVVVRRRVHDASAPPPGKVVDWDPDWRYQAIDRRLDRVHDLEGGHPSELGDRISLAAPTAVCGGAP